MARATRKGGKKQSGGESIGYADLSNPGAVNLNCEDGCEEVYLKSKGGSKHATRRHGRSWC